eukprot:237535-Lingulodinium_polyedra.AAC.1
MIEFIDRGFDAVTLAMAMQVRTAPRLLTKANAVSSLVWAGVSILAGCRFSNVFGRNALVETIHRVRTLVPEAPPPSRTTSTTWCSAWSTRASSTSWRPPWRPAA